ncbi:Cytosol non-specific dipeptidase [Anaerotruncus sp. 2789STDY5834896]|uniref:Cytosol non-specific dipeptidase n=1 Tax=uncultured Anaerotruncus sp. TaxID=905011 RepID=A0A1C6GAD2_9FIRM|nr:Cytosol non-specific dipeptidase [uncultured Anaerotruncus sp.]
MSYITEGLKPELALRYFEDLCAIPHNSGDEAAVVSYLQQFAKEHGLWCRVDEARNVVIKKPATPGYGNSPTVMLQGHTDMVCVKLPGVEHDFAKDPLTLQLKDGVLTASGTTLGADDGTAVAHMLALLSDDSYEHPALECVFTSMEEIGLIGAMKLDTGDLQAQYLIAMDSGAGREDVTTVSCAGGLVLDIRRQPQWEPVDGGLLTLTIEGLLGGHSAMAIDRQRGNAIKLMGRILHDMAAVSPLRIASLRGGSKMNAIAADAVAVVCAEDPAAAGAAARATAAAIKEELSASDAGFTFTCTDGGGEQKALTAGCTAALIDLLYLLPDGVRAMSMDMPGLVVASSNVGVLTVGEDEILVRDFVRSAEDSLRDLIGGEIDRLCALLGFAVTVDAKFSGWKFDPNSRLRALATDLYQRTFARQMELNAVHGGMEIGEFKAKMPHLDIVSFAPDCGNPHTPEEYLNIQSFDNIYRFLQLLLTEIAHQH